jgi:hypothetical protein
LRWWYHQDIRTLRPLITKYPREYLQGRFDSDGYVQRFATGICGARGHREVLELDRELCLKLGMRAGAITKVGPRPGQPYSILGREVSISQQGLRFYVNARDFGKLFGRFHDEYKQEEFLRTLGKYKGRGWTPWNEALRSEAIKMHLVGGLNSAQIARRLSSEHSINLSNVTVYFWLHRGTSSFESYDLRRARNIPE